MTRSSAERPTYRVQVLERAVDILQVLSEDARELGAGEVAERLSLHKSTIHRLLMVLDQHRLIRRNSETGKYALGLRLFELGTRAVRGLQLREQAQPFLERLARDTGETAHICVRDRSEMVSIAYAEAARSLRMPATVGRRTPAYCSAVGKAMLAFLPESAVDDILPDRPLQACTRKPWPRGSHSSPTCAGRGHGAIRSTTRRSRRDCGVSADPCGTIPAKSSPRSALPAPRSASPRAASLRSLVPCWRRRAASRRSWATDQPRRLPPQSRRLDVICHHAPFRPLSKR
jgi:DNA-binding IclR family transcriptional regulator